MDPSRSASRPTSSRSNALNAPIALFALALGGVAACADADLSGAIRNESPDVGRTGGDRPPNVLFLSLDTLRADRLAQAPFLSTLAEVGLFAPRTWSSSSWTLPAHVSLFTSKDPIEHDTPRAGVPLPYAGQRIPSELVTLAEVFQGAGYATGASTDGGYLDEIYGFARGFDQYRSASLADVAGDFSHHEAFVEAFLGERGERPFFLFVHTYKIHDYFQNTSEYHRFVDPVADAEQIAHGSWRDEVRVGKAPPDYVSRLYDSGVELVDSFVETLVERVESQSPDEELLVVVISDHGESFGEHPNAWHHGTALWEEQLRVPLIVWGNYEGAPRGRIEAPISLVDVAPAVLDEVGLAIPDTFRGRSEILRVAETGALSDPRPIFAGTAQTAGGLETGRVNHAVIREGWKYLRSDRFDGQTVVVKCFHIAEDAAERVDRLDTAECARFPALIGPRMERSLPGALLVRSSAPLAIEVEPIEVLVGVRSAAPSSAAILPGGAAPLRWSPASDGDVLALLFARDPEAISVQSGGGAAPTRLPWEEIGTIDQPTRIDFAEASAALFRTPFPSVHEASGEVDRDLVEQLRALGYAE